jgi:hypothetical protein
MYQPVWLAERWCAAPQSATGLYPLRRFDWPDNGADFELSKTADLHNGVMGSCMDS